jgi:hypothetical protein
MNRKYRSIWNEKTGTFVATSENAKSNGNKSSPGTSALARGVRFALKGLAVSLMLAFGSNGYALPTGGAVSADNASIAGGAGASDGITRSAKPADAVQLQKFDRPVTPPRVRQA